MNPQWTLGRQDFHTYEGSSTTRSLSSTSSTPLPLPLPLPPPPAPQQILPSTTLLPPPQNQRQPYTSPTSNLALSHYQPSGPAQISSASHHLTSSSQAPSVRLPSVRANPDSSIHESGPISHFGLRYVGDDLISKTPINQQREDFHFSSFQDLLGEGQAQSTSPHPLQRQDRSHFQNANSSEPRNLPGIHDYYERLPPRQEYQSSSSEHRFHQSGRPSYSTLSSSLPPSYGNRSSSSSTSTYPSIGSGSTLPQFSLPPVNTSNHYHHGFYMSQESSSSTPVISRPYSSGVCAESPESENAPDNGYASNSDEEVYESSGGNWCSGGIGTLSNPSSPVGQYFPPGPFGQHPSRRYSISGEDVTSTTPNMDPSNLKSFHYKLPLTDRPFKCDKCPQSFNRNHDLKRHKRIHLSIKPFPCQTCDKQFSRKDALKRHILVKRCGQAPAGGRKEPSKPTVSHSDSEV